MLAALLLLGAGLSLAAAPAEAQRRLTFITNDDTLGSTGHIRVSSSSDVARSSVAIQFTTGEYPVPVGEGGYTPRRVTLHFGDNTAETIPNSELSVSIWRNNPVNGQPLNKYIDLINPSDKDRGGDGRKVFSYNGGNDLGRNITYHIVVEHDHAARHLAIETVGTSRVNEDETAEGWSIGNMHRGHPGDWSSYNISPRLRFKLECIAKNVEPTGDLEVSGAFIGNAGAASIVNVNLGTLVDGNGFPEDTGRINWVLNHYDSAEDQTPADTFQLTSGLQALRVMGREDIGKYVTFGVAYTDRHHYDELVETDRRLVLERDATVVTVAPQSPTAIAARGAVFVLTRTGRNLDAALTVGLSWGGRPRDYRSYDDRPLEATFDPGAATTEVTIRGASQEPGDGVDLVLSVASGSGYAVGDPATATVRAIGPPAIARLTLTGMQSSTVLEGERIHLTASLHESGTNNRITASENFRMNFVFTQPTVCGISSNAATAADYAGDGTASVDFRVGDTAKAFSIRTLVDSDTTESDERICVQIDNSEPRGAYITYDDSSALTLTIQNVADADLPVVTVAPKKARVTAGTGAGSENAVFVLTRTGGDMSAALTVGIAISGSGPQATSVAANTMATFRSNEPTTEVSIQSRSIGDGDPDENVILTLQPGATYTIGTPRMATVVTTEAVNQPADGMPSITGPAQVGRTLTAGVGDISDPDGSAPTAVAGFAWQWEREDATDVWTPISGAAAYRYTLAAADEGKRVRVVASYTDSATGFPESLESAPTAAVTAVAESEVSVAGDGSVRSGEDAVFTITRTEPTAGELTVTLSYIGSGHVTSPAPPATATFAAGAATVKVSVPTVDIPRGTGIRSVTLRVRRGTGYTLLQPGIRDRADVTVLEPVNRPATGEALLTGTPEVGQTLTAAPGTVDDPDGLTSPTYVYRWSRTPAGGGSSDEFQNSEEPTYMLQAVDIGQVIRVTLIFNDDLGNLEQTVDSNIIGPVVASGDAAPLPVITASAVQASVISTRPAVFTLSRSGSPAAALTVSISLEGDSTAYLDYAGRPTMAEFAAGSSTATVSIPTPGHEPGESDNIDLTVSTGSAYTVAAAPNNMARVRVMGPSVEARIALAQGQSAMVNEGSAVRFTVTLYSGSATAPATENFTMNYRLLNASDCSVSDIASAADIVGDGTGSVDFRIGDTTKTFEVRTLIDSDTSEGDESICANIEGVRSSPRGAFATFGTNGYVAATILDVDSAVLPVVTVSAAAATVDVAPNAAAVFTFSRTASTTNALVVDFSVAPTGVLESAPPPSVTIGASQTEATLRLPVTALENEVGTVALSIDDASDNRYAVGASPGNAATVTVRGPVVPVLSIHPPSLAAVNEGESLTFTVRLSAPAETPFTVSYRIDSASLAQGQVPASAQDVSGSGAGTVSFAAGETEKTFTVTTLVDGDTSEGDEILALALGLANPAGAALQGDAAESVAQATIRDVSTPVVSVRHGGNVYGGQNAEFTFSRTGSTAAALTVNFEVTGNGAVRSPAPPGSATFAAGSPTARASVPTVAIASGGAVRNVVLTLQGGAGYRVIGGGVGSRASLSVRGRPANQPATGAAMLSGVPEADLALTARPGSIDDANGLTSPSYLYRWSRVNAGTGAAEVIEGANAPTYTMVAADVGHLIEVTLSFNDDFGYPEMRRSNRVGPVRPSSAPVIPVVTVAATSLGVENGASAEFILTRRGRDLSASLNVSLQASGDGAGASAPSSATFAAGSATVRVMVATASIAPGGTNQELTLAVQEGAGYALGTPASVTVTVLAPENNIATGAPSLSGTARVGEMLTAGIGNISDADDPPAEADLRFSWAHELAPGVWAQIEGASGNTYLLVDADEGRRVRVTASFDDAVFDVEESVVSAATATVVAIGADPLPTVSVSAASSRVDSGQNATFVFTRSGDTAEALGVSYDIFDPEDVLTVNVPGSITIPAGADEVRVGFPTRVGANQRETVTANVSHGEGVYDFGTPRSVTVTVSGPVVPMLAVHPPDPATATEGDDLVFTLRLSSVARGAFTVGYRLAAGSQATSADIQGSGTGTVSFSAGDRMQTFTITTREDGLDEDPETIAFVIDAPSDANFALPGTPAMAEAVISDVVNTPATGAPAISGTAQAGETLRADTTGIMDDNGLERARMGDAGHAFTYQWSRVNADGTGAVVIRNATEASYTLTVAEHRRRVRVTVRFTDDDGYPEVRTSANSDVVLDDASVSAEMARDTVAAETMLDRFGTAVVTQVFDSVKMRFDAPRAPGVQATLAGYRFGGGGGAGMRGAGGVGARGLSSGAPVTGGSAAAAGGDMYAGGFGAVGGRSSTAGLPGLADGVDIIDGGMEFGAGAGSTGSTGTGLAGVSTGTAGRAALRGPNAGAGSSSAVKLPSGRDLLHASSFSLTHETPSGAFASVWGRGAYTSFEDRKGALELDGEISTGQFGVDWSSGAWLLGLSAAHSLGESDYAETAFGEGGRIETALTGLYPYIGYRIHERLSAWGTVGYGEASLTFERQGQDEVKTDMDTRMGAAGLRGDLLRPGATGGFGLSLRADAVFVRTRSDEVAGSLSATSNNTRRLRVGLESSHSIVFESGARLSPIIELGVLHDDGDLEDGTGTDIEAGILYAGVGGFSVDLRARSLVTHEVSGRKEWGVSGVLRYDPSPASGLGPAFSLKSGVGARTTGGVDDMFALRMSDGIDELGEGAPSAARMEAELGYGLSALGGMFTGTPWLRFGLAEAGSDWRLGWRFTPLAEHAPELRTGIEFGERGSSGQEVRFKLDTRF